MEIPRYLVATNNPVLQAPLTCRLAEHGYVYTVTSSNAALMAAIDYQPKHYALIFIDNSLLSKIGVASVPLFRRYTHAPVINVGVLITAAKKKACFRAGMQQVVTQPIHREEITRLIKMYVI